MSQTLYRKYRSRSLDEILGQDHVTSLLRRAIASGDISQAYLLTGPHGVGKTSIARIIAHAINELEYNDESNHMDIIEIDAASNNGVEDVRDLRDKVRIAPTSAKRKVYIIDEVHMLSKPAFNALLKTLEEPPDHVVFILATTDAEKLPATIISRVQRFNLRAINDADAVRHLRMIADSEKIAIDDDALQLIARHGNGSFRDSIGLLDQLRSSVAETGTVGISDVESALGITTDQTIIALLESYRTGDLESLAHTIRNLEQSGAQAATVASQLIRAIQADIAQYVDDLPLLDALLDVASSSHPYIKLLAVLAKNVATAPKNTLPSPSSVAAPPLATDDSTVPTKPDQDDIATSPFDWQALLDATQSEVALISLLKKSGHALADNTLTIYAGNKFNAGRLMGPKLLPKLNEALDTIGVSGLQLNIAPTKAPLSDSQAASVAAIMGGGEEVEL